MTDPAGLLAMVMSPEPAPEPKKDFLAEPAIADFIEKDLEGLLSDHLYAWEDDLYGMIRGALMYSGRHWLATDNGKIVDYLLEDQEASKLLYTDNYTKPLTDQLTSRVVSRNVKWKTKPASSDESDIQRSKGNDKLLNYIYEQRSVRQLLKRRAQYIMQFGRAFTSAIPNFNSGVMMPDEVNQAGVPQIEVHPGLLVQGHISFEDNQQSPYMIRWRRLYRADAERRFKRTFSQGSGRLSGRETPLSMQQYLIDTNAQTDSIRDLIMLPEIWIHPYNGLLDQKVNQKGLTILFDYERKEAIEIKEWDYPFSGYKNGKPEEEPHYPFWDTAYARVIGTARALGVCQILEEKQRDLNRVETMIRWAVNIAASPILQDPDGGATEEDRTIEAGAIWKWNWQNGQPPPGFMQPPQMSAGLTGLPEIIKNDMRELVMVREVSLASQGGADSGVMLAQMTATDQANFSQYYVDDDDCMANVCRDILKETTVYMPPAFKLQVLGHKNGASRTQVMQTQHIDPMTDIIAVADPFSYETPNMTEERHLKRVTQGIETQQDMMLAVEGRDPNEDKYVDIDKANYENETMEKQDVPPPGVADVHPVHIEQHGLEIRSIDFLMKPPEVQKRKIEHYQMHKTIEQQQMAQNAQMQPMGPAAQQPPPPKPKPAPADATTQTQMRGQSLAVKGPENPEEVLAARQASVQ